MVDIDKKDGKVVVRDWIAEKSWNEKFGRVLDCYR